MNRNEYDDNKKRERSLNTPNSITHQSNVQHHSYIMCIFEDNGGFMRYDDKSNKPRKEETSLHRDRRSVVIILISSLFNSMLLFVNMFRWLFLSWLVFFSRLVLYLCMGYFFVISVEPAGLMKIDDNIWNSQRYLLNYLLSKYRDRLLILPLKIHKNILIHTKYTRKYTH